MTLANANPHPVATSPPRPTSTATAAGSGSGSGSGSGAGSGAVPPTTSASADKPREVDALERILASMDIEAYDPQVIHQLVEFVHRYVSEVLYDARTYMQHANRKDLVLSDVKLAIEAKVNHSFSSAPSLDLMLDLASVRNAKEIPPVPLDSAVAQLTVALPPKEDQIALANFQIDPNSVVSAAASTAAAAANTGAAVVPVAGSSKPSARK
eukprot:ANDGO_01222.mRNA.1 Transcription initiation factor TFIID subunit 9